ncbi:MAG TPA: SAM-dependent methyltransferase [Burkholderiaceae bacterium]|nr:SAM-dependent methyltransferase [Burkholderiaceae bacterium]
MNDLKKGRLYLVPVPLDFGCESAQKITDTLPLATLERAANIQHWVCENAKSTRAFLKRVNDICPLPIPLQSQNIQELPREVHKKGDHQGALGEGFDAKPLLQPALAGSDIGLVSEAGMPAIADPGSSVVRAAHALKIEVIPLVGPISLMLALAASGLNGQNFAFVGYLPQDAEHRTKRIKELEAYSRQTHQTQLFIETPYRNAALLKFLLQTLNPNTHLSLSLGLTLDTATTRSHKVAFWRQIQSSLPLSLPAVFGILA